MHKHVCVCVCIDLWEQYIRNTWMTSIFLIKVKCSVCIVNSISLKSVCHQKKKQNMLRSSKISQRKLHLYGFHVTWTGQVHLLLVYCMTMCMQVFLSFLLSRWCYSLLQRIQTSSMAGWLVGFYGISTFVGYLMPSSTAIHTRMLRAILNKSWQQHPTRRQLYNHLPPIMKTIQARQTRHAGHCWRSKDEIVSDVL